MHVQSFKHHPGLMADLYHPDAAYVSWCTHQNGLATFDLYTRTPPFGGAYVLIAGVEEALAFAQAFHYTPENLQFLAQIRDYDAMFLEELARLHFTGEILALPEGSIAFPNEPILRVTAPFREALLLEAGVIQAINLATLIATKAARVVFAANYGHPRQMVEFAFRRAQEPFTVARSSFIGGCSSTSFLDTAFAFHLPATGTVPHALIEIFATEREAFEAIASCNQRYTLLLDTYHPRHAIHTAIAVALRAQDRFGHTLIAVRLDSGDLLGDSCYVREQLDRAGLAQVRVVASGDLDEWKILQLLRAGASIDAFGVGTALGAGIGSVEQRVAGGALGAAYKIVWYVDETSKFCPPIKTAGSKSTWPGKKAVYRHPRWEEDVIQLEQESPPEQYQQILQPMMRGGHLLAGSTPPLPTIRERAHDQLQRLPPFYQKLRVEHAYPVRFSEQLHLLRQHALSLRGTTRS